MNIDTKKKDAIKAFEKFGFSLVSEKEHIKMKNDKGETISVPNHKRIKGSTLSRICREKGIDKQKFFSFC